MTHPRKTDQSLHKLTASMPGTPEVDYPRPERLIAGNSKRETWNTVDVAVQGARVYGGVWRCEPGHWRIEMMADEHELFTVIAGRCRVHAADGSFQEAGPGEALVIPGGFCGSFEVIEPLTKTYTIVTAA